MEMLAEAACRSLRVVMESHPCSMKRYVERMGVSLGRTFLSQ